MGKSVSHVELDIPKLNAKEIIEVEDECNRIIRNAKPVQVQYLTIAEAMELEEVKITNSFNMHSKYIIKIISLSFRRKAT